MSRNLRNSYCLFSFAAVESLYGRFLSLNMFLIGTNEMRRRPRRAYSDHGDKSELSAQILVRRQASPSAAQPRSRRSTGKAARVMKTHPIPRHSYWSGINGEPLVLTTATQDTIFNHTFSGCVPSISMKACAFKWRVCRRHTDSTARLHPSKASAHG